MDFVSSDAEAYALRDPDVRADAAPMLLRPISPATPLEEAPPPAPEPAAAELPVGLGVLLVMAYAALLAGFYVAFGGDAEVELVLGVCAVYLAIYLGVPVVLLRMEGAGGRARPDMADFARDGFLTYTGWLSARAAMTQMLIVPVALTVGALGLGLIYRLAG